MNSNGTTLHTAASRDSINSLSDPNGDRRMDGTLVNKVVPLQGGVQEKNTSKEPKLQFVEHFWGSEDLGLGVILARLSQGKQTARDIKEMFCGRANLEEEYGKKLLKLAKGGLGKDETGTLKETLDIVRAELELTGRSHVELAQQIRTELDTTLGAFIGRQRDIRKPTAISMEKSLRTKITNTNIVLKAKEKCESECTKAGSLNGAKSTLSGKELEKCKAKLEKTEISARNADREYASAVDKLEDVTKRWEAEWRAALEQYQGLEEERIAFLKGSMWTYTYLVSGVCVTDDESCERIRVSLEKCDVDTDMAAFVKANRTGGELPQPVGYINFLPATSNRNEGIQAPSIIPYNANNNRSQSLSNSAQSIPSQLARKPIYGEVNNGSSSFLPADTGAPTNMNPMPGLGISTTNNMGSATSMVEERDGSGYMFQGFESTLDSRGLLAGTRNGGGGMANGSKEGLPTVSSDGRPVMFYVKCMYDFTATIPEELEVREGDIISCIATQDDGWWEGEVSGLKDGDPRKRLGLYPSNFTARL